MNGSMRQLFNEWGDPIGCMSVNIPTGWNEQGISCEEEEYGSGNPEEDAFFADLNYEDMLREVSKLPPSERKEALKKMKKRRRGL